MNAGVDRMITVGTDLEDWDLYGELAKSYRGKIDYTVGIHPCSVDESWELASSKDCRFLDKGKGARRLRRNRTGSVSSPQDESDAERVFNPAIRRVSGSAGNYKETERTSSRALAGAFMECVQVIDDSGNGLTRVVFHCFSEGA